MIIENEGESSKAVQGKFTGAVYIKMKSYKEERS